MKEFYKRTNKRRGEGVTIFDQLKIISSGNMFDFVLILNFNFI